MTASDAPNRPGTLSVCVEDAHVRYRVYEDRNFSVREFLRSGPRKAVEVHALKGVSFDIRIGEFVGIVGSNGSGKSTLLRAIASVQPVSSGRVLVRGEAHLLGVGAALKPALSGHRNVLLGGLAMGLSRDEIEEKLDEVIEFSGLADAINRPMDTYSSGMRSRLAFSIATLRIPDVLLVDEALAVGDREFRQKSLERLKEVREKAGTVVMVTHNLKEIRQTCSRAIWIERGELVADGAVREVLDAYASNTMDSTEERLGRPAGAARRQT